MKIKFIKYILILFVLVGCDNFNIPKGDLIVNVQYVSSEKVKGADIYLYDNESDMTNEKNVFYFWQITDTSGTANFKNIDAQKYWVLCKMVNKSNELISLTDTILISRDSTSTLQFKP